jgi:hypothetical protein
MLRLWPVFALCSSALVLSACGTATSTSGFKGAEHEVAQRIADLQSDVTAADRGKICGNDLAAPVVKGLGGRKGCEAALKHQINQIDNPEVTINAVKLSPDGKSATASVKSIHEGNSRTSTVALVKEGKSWRVSAP